MEQFVVGIIGSIIASFLYDAIRSKDAQSPPIIQVVHPAMSPTSQEPSEVTNYDERAANRGQAGRILLQLVFFAFTFLILKLAINIPILLGQDLFGDTVDLSRIKVIGWFAKSTLPMSSVDTITTILAMLVYVPIIVIGDRLLEIVKGWYDKFWPVTFEAWILLRAVTFLFVALLLSGFVTFAVTDLSLVEAMAAPFIALIVLVIFVVASGEKN